MGKVANKGLKRKVGIGTIESKATKHDVQTLKVMLGAKNVVLPLKGQTILTPPSGYVGIYTRSVTHGNLRFPLSRFLLDVLKYYGCPLFLFHPTAILKVINFEVLCCAHGGKASVRLFRSFFQLFSSGDWVTLARRNKDQCFREKGSEVREWKEKYVFVGIECVPKGYEMLLQTRETEWDFNDPDPTLEGEDLDLCGRLVRGKMSVQVLPNAALFCAGLVSEWEGGSRDPVFNVGGEEMSFNKFVTRDSGAEVSVATKDAPIVPKDAASPVMIEGEASSKMVLDQENVFGGLKNVEELDCEFVGETPATARVGTRRSKRNRGDTVADVAKKGKKVPAIPLPPKRPTRSAIEVLRGDDSSAEGVSKMNARIEEQGVSEEWKQKMKALVAAGVPCPEVEGIVRMLSLGAFLEDMFTDLADEGARMLMERVGMEKVVEETKGEMVKLKSQVEADVENSELVKELRRELEQSREGLQKNFQEAEGLRGLLAEKSIIVEQLRGDLAAAKQEAEVVKVVADEMEARCGDMVTRGIPYVVRELMNSDELAMKVGKFVNLSRAWERSVVYEEMGVDLATMPKYNPNAESLAMAAGKEINEAVFPFVEAVSSNPKITVEELLKMKHVEL